MAKRETEEPEEAGCPLWMMTFGDMISLLVTFFVMLVSFASFEEHSLMGAVSALQGGLRAVQVVGATVTGAAGNEDSEEEPSVVKEPAHDHLGYSLEEFEPVVQANSYINMYTQDFYLRLVRNDLSLVIRQDSMFEPGTARLVSDNIHIWRATSDLMHAVKGEVRIEITLWENAVVRSEKSSTPWGLGIEQAMVIRESLIADYHANPSQISTSVRVVGNAALPESANGVVEIIYVGVSASESQYLSERIMRGSWRESVGGKRRGERG